MALSAREGWVYVVPAVLAGIASHHFLGWWGGLPFWILCLLLLVAFRDPERNIPSLPLAVLSPVDGKVAEVRKGHDPYLDREAIVVSIDMYVSGTYTTRSPIEGKVIQRWYSMGGRGREADDSDGDRRYGIWVQTDEREDVVLVMHGGRLWQRPHCYVQYGDRVGQGQRCGFVTFGARIDVLVPVTTRVEVRVGDRLGGGRSVIGTLMHRGEG